MGCNPAAQRCGGSTPPVRIGDVAQRDESTSLAPRRSRFETCRLHLASVVSTASTRPLYGRGAGSTPAGGSSDARSSVESTALIRQARWFDSSRAHKRT